MALQWSGAARWNESVNTACCKITTHPASQFQEIIKSPYWIKWKKVLTSQDVSGSSSAASAVRVRYMWVVGRSSLSWNAGNYIIWCHIRMACHHQISSPFSRLEAGRWQSRRNKWKKDQAQNTRNRVKKTHCQRRWYAMEKFSMR